MRIVQLMASPFFGGPEKQMLGLARSLPASYDTVFLTFAERGLSRSLLEQVRKHGFEGRALKHNFPHIRRAARELAEELRRLQADVVCCSGYKPDIIGWIAARQAGVPAVSVSHGWTSVTPRVRVYEAADKFLLRWFDAVVCVSDGQAAKARAAGVPEKLITVVRNAIDVAPFAEPIEPRFRAKLEAMFPVPPRLIVGAAGRLSPEKGFAKLIEAAALVVSQQNDVGFVIFGDGPSREALGKQINGLGLEKNVILGGFHNDLERWLPHLDLAVSSSLTEGLPVALLEAQAAGLAVVATAVGGTPEVVEEGRSGYLVPPGDAPGLARRIGELLGNSERRAAFGRLGRERVHQAFTFASQSLQYQELFEKLASRRPPAGPGTRRIDHRSHRDHPDPRASGPGDVPRRFRGDRGVGGAPDAEGRGRAFHRTHPAGSRLAPAGGGERRDRRADPNARSGRPGLPIRLGEGRRGTHRHRLGSTLGADVVVQGVVRR